MAVRTKTIIPSYPWSTEEVVTKYIPNINKTKLFLVNPDAYLLEINNPIHNYADGSYWCIDNPKTDWYRKVSVSLSNPQVNYRATKWEGNKDILTRISSSMGVLVSVYKSGNPWWFSTLSQALYIGVPAVTDWRLTTHMGPEWSMLPNAIEEMSPIERVEVSKKQKKILYPKCTLMGECKRKYRKHIVTKVVNKLTRKGRKKWLM